MKAVTKERVFATLEHIQVIQSNVPKWVTRNNCTKRSNLQDQRNAVTFSHLNKKPQVNPNISYTDSWRKKTKNSNTHSNLDF